MLTPGEFVMSKGAVQKYGADTLAGMNAAAGGTNKPTVISEYNKGGSVDNYFNQGGSVDNYFNQGGLVNNIGNTSNTINTSNTSNTINSNNTTNNGKSLVTNFTQRFQGGGQVRQMGRGSSNSRMKLASQQKKMNTPGTSSGKKTTVAYQDQGGSMKSAGGTRQPGNKEIPSFSAIAKRSPEKIRVLGISV